MGNWLGKVTKHPLGATVFGTVIATAIIGAYTRWFGNLWAWIESVWVSLSCRISTLHDWLTAAAPVPRYLFISLVVLAAMLGFWGGVFYAKWATRRFRANHPREAIATNAVAADAPVLSAANALDAPTLTEKDWKILKRVAEADGAMVMLWEIQGSFGWTHLESERNAERLELAGLLVRLYRGGADGKPGFKLTKRGRDIVLDHSWLDS